MTHRGPLSFTTLMKAYSSATFGKYVPTRLYGNRETIIRVISYLWTSLRPEQTNGPLIFQGCHFWIDHTLPRDTVTFKYVAEMPDGPLSDMPHHDVTVEFTA